VSRALPRDAVGDLAAVVLGGRDLERQALSLEGLTRAGVHPLRIRFLDAWRFLPNPAAMETHVRAAIARLRAAEPVDRAPMRATTTFRGYLPRRSLFVPLPRFRAPLPRLVSARCRAISGCHLCVSACPSKAIAKGTPPTIDAATCTSCGLCVAACPADAVGHPALSVDALAAEAEALADIPHRNLLVACTPVLLGGGMENLRLEPERWRILEVPALGVFRATDVLRLRRAGFDRVVGLGAGPCCPGGPGPFAVAAAFLDGLGLPGLVGHWDLEDGPLPARWSLPAADEVLLPATDSLPKLAAALGSVSAPIELPGRGAGLVVLDAARCTLCGLCAERCIPGALAAEQPEPGALRLVFDAAMCDGCALCADVCPERALTVRRAVDPRAVGSRAVLKEDAWVLCASCGTRVAPVAMVARVAAQLRRPLRLDLCPDCKPLTLASHIGFSR